MTLAPDNFLSVLFQRTFDCFWIITPDYLTCIIKVLGSPDFRHQLDELYNFGKFGISEIRQLYRFLVVDPHLEISGILKIPILS